MRKRIRPPAANHFESGQPEYGRLLFHSSQTIQLINLMNTRSIRVLIVIVLFSSGTIHTAKAAVTLHNGMAWTNTWNVDTGGATGIAIAETFRSGGLDVGTGITPGATFEGLQVDYFQNFSGSTDKIVFELMQPSGVFEWKDDGTGTPNIKMRLDENNKLALFNSSGTETISINGAAVALQAINVSTSGLSVGGTASVTELSAGSISTGPISSGAISATTYSGNSINLSGTATAGSFSGSGASLTGLTATNLSGLVPIANGGTNASSAATALSNLGGIGSATTNTLTNKTFDAAGTGNVMKLIDEIHLTSPHQVDGTGAVIDPVSTAPTYGHAIFAHGTDKATNFALYRFRVPFDLDTATDLQASFTFRLAAADTGKHAYEISMSDVAASASADAPAFSNAVALNFAGDASGASGDIETVAYTTLTSWKTSLTAGRIIVIKLARDGDDGTNDTSTQPSTDVELSIKYGRAQ